MPSKTSQIVDPRTTNIVYHLEVLDTGDWYLYPLITNEQPNYADAITKLSDIPNKNIRQQVELEIGRLKANLRAN